MIALVGLIPVMPVMAVVCAQDPPIVDPVFARLPEEQAVASTVDTPVAVRGGVLVLPLRRRSREVAWPSSIDLLLSDGRKIAGSVVRVTTRDPTQSHWTMPAVVVATEVPTGDVDIALLAPLPVDGEDSVMLGRQELEPIWMDPLPPAQPPARDSDLTATDTPDVTAPNEHFRAVLQAHRLGITAPTPAMEGTDALYARAVAGLWSAAIARLAEQDPVIAESVLSDLAGRARLPGERSARSLAVWETNESELAQLLRTLLEPRVDGIILAESARTWLEGRSPLAIWVDQDVGEALVLAIANPRNTSVRVTIRWPDRRDAAFSGDIAPEAIEFVRIERPAWTAPAGPVIDEALAEAMALRGLARLLPPADLAPESPQRSAMEIETRAPRTLTIDTGTATSTVLVGPGRVGARPPGSGFGTFLPPANLAAIRSGALRGPPPEWSTYLGLRKRPAGWELIVECRSPQGAVPNRDEIAIIIDGGFQHSVLVASNGEVEAGSESVEAGTRVHHLADCWRARIPVPDEWLSSKGSPAAHISLSAQRRVSGSGSDAPPRGARLQSAGMVPLCIDPTPRMIPLDLSGWTLPSVTLGP